MLLLMLLEKKNNLTVGSEWAVEESADLVADCDRTAIANRKES